jgi:hypothetical protein
VPNNTEKKSFGNFRFAKTEKDLSRFNDQPRNLLDVLSNIRSSLTDNSIPPKIEQRDPEKTTKEPEAFEHGQTNRKISLRNRAPLYDSTMAEVGHRNGCVVSRLRFSGTLRLATRRPRHDRNVSIPARSSPEDKTPNAVAIVTENSHGRYDHDRK